jgi:hypothetical protein
MTAIFQPFSAVATINKGLNLLASRQATGDKPGYDYKHPCWLEGFLRYGYDWDWGKKKTVK